MPLERQARCGLTDAAGTDAPQAGASRITPVLADSDFRIAFFAVCAIGLASVALYASLCEHVGAEVSGRERLQ